MTDTLLSIIGTLIAAVVGVVPGFLLSEWGTSRRDARSERRKAGTVRLIIGIEIDQNLNELKQFQARMDKDQREAPQPHELVLLDILGRIPAPPLSHKVWESQLTNAPLALDRDVIRKVLDHHSKLDAILETKDSIGMARNQVTERNELYGRCLELIKKTIDQGNPIS